MKKLLAANIKKSLKIIAEDNPQIPPNLIEVIDEDPSITKSISRAEILMKIAAQRIPWFYRDESEKLQSPQASFFGFYALRNLIRGIFLSLRFIQAGQLLKRNNFRAASILSFYTASFHLLNSFLAAHGRVIVDIVHGGPIKIIKHKQSETAQYSSLNHAPEIVMAILTNNNKWIFESRSRSHSRRWTELEQVFIKTDYDVPDFFYSLFEYILSYGPSSYAPQEPSELLKEGIYRLTEIRHESIYIGYGDDDFVHDELINRDFSGICGIDLKSNAYHSFAMDFLKYVIEDVMEMKNIVPLVHWNEVQSLMYNSIYTPPFEPFDFKMEDNKELNEKIEDIFVWLTDKTLRDKCETGGVS